MAPLIKHSKGPFHVGTQTTNLGYLEIGDARARRIATIDIRDYRGHSEQFWANAALFSVADELLALVEGYAAGPDPEGHEDLTVRANAVFKKLAKVGGG